MTEVKKIFSYEIKEVVPEIIKEGVKEEPKNQLSQIYTIPEGLELTIKKRKVSRTSKRWKKSINFYYLHPEKFQFGFKDL
jgi:hypothetical protein